MTIDMRSDTFTKPSAAMLQAMMEAAVGDDVFGEDPTVNELENYAADMFSMETALFCPSGTMTNQIAIKCHTQTGDEVICDMTSHVYIYEGGGIAFNSGCQVKALQGERGKINAAQVAGAINPDDVHKSRTALVVLENTANRGGGSCYELADIKAIKSLCLQNNLMLHLDGARLFNALSSTGQDVKQYGRMFDSISVCLSKGLGAPVGSLLLGNYQFIKKARRVRKVLGGGMRQAGYLAAGGLYALRHNIYRLKDDHTHASHIAQVLLQKEFVGKMLPVETNIIIFEVINTHTPQTFCDHLAKHNILCLPVSASMVRMVLHLDVTDEMVEQVLHRLHAME